MPKIKIKRGDYSVSGGGTGVPVLDAGELAVKTGGTDRGRLYVGVVDGDETPDQVRVSYADDAANSVYAQKIGTSSAHPSIGSSVRPVYVDNEGRVTASTGNVGQDSDGGATKWAKPVFMQNGVLTVMSGNAGNHYSPVFMLNGEIRQLYANVGSGTQHVYLSNGSITASTSYVGFDEKDNEGGFKPIYLHNGVFTVATRSHGGDTVPVFVDDGGIRRCRGNVGSSINPIYMDDGEFKPATGNCGGSSATKPLYMSDGKLYPTTDYAGGTKVVLNNVDRGHDNAAIFAPDTIPSNAGTTAAEHTLVEWYDYGAKARWASNSVGSTSKPVYLSNGVIKECSYYGPGVRGYKYDVLVGQENSAVPKWQRCPSAYPDWTGSTSDPTTSLSRALPFGVYLVHVANRSVNEYHTVMLCLGSNMASVGTKAYSSAYCTRRDSGAHALVVVATTTSYSSSMGIPTVSLTIDENINDNSYCFVGVYRIANID